MSAQDIIAELPKLKPDEIRLVKLRVDELTEAAHTKPPQALQPESLSAFLLRVAGTAEGLPSDLAENHDSYLYGTPKRVQ